MPIFVQISVWSSSAGTFWQAVIVDPRSQQDFAKTIKLQHSVTKSEQFAWVSIRSGVLSWSWNLFIFRIFRSLHRQPISASAGLHSNEHCNRQGEVPSGSNYLLLSYPRGCYLHRQFWANGYTLLHMSLILQDFRIYPPKCWVLPQAQRTIPTSCISLRTEFMSWRKNSLTKRCRTRYIT